MAGKYQIKEAQGAAALPVLLCCTTAASGGWGIHQGISKAGGKGLWARSRSAASGSREFRLTNLKATLMHKITPAPFFSDTYKAVMSTMDEAKTQQRGTETSEK